jgi:SagB-type dehydrogenase family enzyme
MNDELWQDAILPPVNEDCVWELFHENSKVVRSGHALSDDEVVARMKEFYLSLPFTGNPSIELPRRLSALKVPLEKAIVSRISVRNMEPCPLELKLVATLLHYAYGESRDNKGTGLPRPFRVVPSGGGLYPLEIFFYSGCVDGLEKGIYHYDPSKSNLHLVSSGDKIEQICKGMVYPEITRAASLIIFITAIFERSTFKYGERGYRFILLEAGHVAQNMNLVTIGLGLGCVNLGGFYDRDIDNLLGLDGVTHSTVYMVAIGAPKENTHGNKRKTKQ